MRKIIIGQPGCSNCKMLKMSCPDAEEVIPQPSELMAIAKIMNVKSLPIVVLTGELGELSKVLKPKEENND